MTRNREIEIKLRVADMGKVIRQLRTMGARRIGRVYETNTLFDTADRDFERREAILRIRCEEKAGSPVRKGRKGAKEGLLTYKGLIKGQKAADEKYKEREEIEYRLPDAARFARVLTDIGMRPWFRYEKFRTRYMTQYAALAIDLDETSIGAFLELEGPKRAIDWAARALGYSQGDYITESYMALYKAECSRRRMKVANMVFKKKKNR